MATYIYNPNTVDVGVNPVGNGWTMRLNTWATSSIVSGETPIGGRFWRYGDNNTTRYTLARFDAVPIASEIVEILSLRRRNNMYGLGHLSRLNESGNVTGYFLGLRNNATDVRGRVWSTTAADMGSAAHSITVDSNWVWARTQSTGSTHRVKTWVYGTAEPAWMLEQTNATYESGGAGIGDFIGALDYSLDVAWYSVGTAGDAAPAGYPRKITITDLKDPNAANSAIADAIGVQVKLWISSDSNDPIDTGAPNVLVTDATITGGTMEVTFDSVADVGNPVLGVAKWAVSTDDYFFPIDTTVQEST